MIFKIRKKKKYTSIRRRFMSLTSNEQVTVNQLKKSMYIVNMIRKSSESTEQQQEYEELLIILANKYICMLIDEYGPLQRPLRMKWTLAGDSL